MGRRRDTSKPFFGLALLLGVSACGTFIGTDIFGGGEDDEAKPALTNVDASDGEGPAKADGAISTGSGSSGASTTGGPTINTSSSSTSTSSSSSGGEEDASASDASDASDASTKDASDSAVASATLYVFVTNKPFDGQITVGDIYADADAICTNEARTAGRAGIFRAWLAASDKDSSQLPWKRIKRAVGSDYRLVDGTLITSNFDELAKGDTPVPAIRLTASGVDVGLGAEVWTGLALSTDVNAVPVASAHNCSGWTSKLDSTLGAYGVVSTSKTAWFSASASSCATPRRLYCVQEP